MRTREREKVTGRGKGGGQDERGRNQNESSPTWTTWPRVGLNNRGPIGAFENTVAAPVNTLMRVRARARRSPTRTEGSVVH